MASRIDEAGHTKAFDYPVVEHWGKAEMFSSPGGTRTDNTSVWSRTRKRKHHPGSPKKEIEASYFYKFIDRPSSIAVGIENRFSIVNQNPITKQCIF